MDLRAHGLNPQFPEVIDASMLKDFIDCPSYFYLRHVLGLKKKYRSKADDAKFDWGTAWHTLMEVYGYTGDPVKALSTMNDFPDSIDPATDRHNRSKERMVQMFFEYVEKFGKEDAATYKDLRHEQAFDIYDEDLGLRWSGRPDRIRRRLTNDKIVIWDYKTTSAFGSNFWNMHEFGFQLPGYVWFANKVFTESVEEVAVDCLYTLKASHQFLRRTFRYTPQALREWASNVKMILERMYYMRDNFLDQPDRWEKNWNHCTRYGLCHFSDVHFLPPIKDSRLRILQNDYFEQRWDPRAIDEE
jgi:hypothetical protein